MTEQEYINATSYMKIKTALDILKDIPLNEDDEIHDSYLRKSRYSLRKLEEMYLDMIDLEESK